MADHKKHFVIAYTTRKVDGKTEVVTFRVYSSMNAYEEDSPRLRAMQKDVLGKTLSGGAFHVPEGEAVDIMGVLKSHGL
jgi:hypothetical protein